LNIRKTLRLVKKPYLGMVPILMAGDKHSTITSIKLESKPESSCSFSAVAMKAKKVLGLFKYGFCNVTTQGSKNALKRMTGISSKNKLKIMYYYP